MKLFLLALFSLILTVSSKSEKPKTKPAKDQKTDDSAFLQKFLVQPLHHKTHQRYGMNHGHGDPRTVEELLKNDHGHYDYLDDDHEDHSRHDGRLRGHHNQANIWGYARNGGHLGRLVSHSYNGDQNVWGYLRNNMGHLGGHHLGHHGHGYGHNGKRGYDGGLGLDGRHGHGDRPRYDGRLKNTARIHLQQQWTPLESRQRHLDQGNVEHGHEDWDVQNVLRSMNLPLEPDHIGYVGHVDPHGYGIKERYSYRLIGRRGLGFDRRTATSYGLMAPITPKSLQVVGQRLGYDHYIH